MPAPFFEFPEGFLDPGLPKGAVSPSQFNMYRRCPRQYQYRYIDNIKQAPAISMVRGTAIHYGAEVTHQHTIDTGTPLPYAEAAELLRDKFVKETEWIDGWDPKKDGGYIDNAVMNFKAYYLNAVPLIKPVRVESKFTINIGTVPTYGIIDLIDSTEDTDMSLENDPDNPNMVEVVADLKTVGKKWSDQKVECEPQMTFYAVAENTSRVRVDLLLGLKKGAKYLPMRAKRTAWDKKILVEDLEEVVYYIKQGVFPRCDPTGWVCTPKFCGFYERCKGPK